MRESKSETAPAIGAALNLDNAGLFEFLKLFLGETQLAAANRLVIRAKPTAEEVDFALP